MCFNRKSLTSVSLAVLCGVGAVSVPAVEVKLKAASFLPERAVFAKHFYHWVNSVNKGCAGDVSISVVGPAAIKSLETLVPWCKGSSDLDGTIRKVR